LEGSASNLRKVGENRCPPAFLETAGKAGRMATQSAPPQLATPSSQLLEGQGAAGRLRRRLSLFIGKTCQRLNWAMNTVRVKQTGWDTCKG